MNSVMREAEREMRKAFTLYIYIYMYKNSLITLVSAERKVDVTLVQDSFMKNAHYVPQE